MAGDSEGSPVELDRRPSVNTATRRFQNISAILRELYQAGLKMQTVNDLLTVYVGAAIQHTLRTTRSGVLLFRRRNCACRSQLVGRDTTSPLFHLPLRIPRYSDTLQYHGQPGSESFPL